MPNTKYDIVPKTSNKTLNKVTMCNYRIEFLKQCINNDKIQEILSFRAPKKEVFSEKKCARWFTIETAETEINRAVKCSRKNLN